MSHMSDTLIRWSHQTATVYSATTWDANGMPVQSTGDSHTVLIQYNTRAAIDSQGKQRVSNCQILFRSSAEITIDDKLVLPDNTSPIIISIEKPTDFDGNREYVKVYT